MKFVQDTGWPDTSRLRLTIFYMRGQLPGLCDSCGVDEDVYHYWSMHYLMECIDQRALRSTLQIIIHKNCRNKYITLNEILNNKIATD